MNYPKNTFFTGPFLKFIRRAPGAVESYYADYAYAGDTYRVNFTRDPDGLWSPSGDYPHAVREWVAPLVSSMNNM